MRYSFAFCAAMAASVQAHGVVRYVHGANNVTMPGVSIKDGTPRGCITPACGAEADTSIIRKNELGTNKASALGRTSTGPVDIVAAVNNFMGAGGGATGVQTRGIDTRGLLGDLLGGGGAGGGAGGATSQGTKVPRGTIEMGVAASAGLGATAGLPTAANDGTITMTFHQVNQDGAGPLTAQIDPTSGGTDPAAFVDAKVTMNVPGLGVGGLSAASATQFPVQVQMPAGMQCLGQIGVASQVCVVRMQNAALAGPFGGSGVFTQTSAQRKRAVEYMRAKRGVEQAFAA